MRTFGDLATAVLVYNRKSLHHIRTFGYLATVVLDVTYTAQTNRGGVVERPFV